MNRLQHGCLIAGLFAGLVLNPIPSQAQYSANYQTNIISGVTSNWVNADYIVGTVAGGFNPTPFADVLLIQNSGVFTIAGAPPSYGFTVGWSSSNTVLVTDPGSALVVGNTTVFIGNSGADNSLVISNGGKMVTSGFSSQVDVDGSSGNSIVVTDTGSVWSNNVPLVLGRTGTGSSLVICNSGLMVDGLNIFGYIGFMAGSSNNSVLVTDAGSVWKNQAFVFLGYGGNGNSLVISDGGSVFARIFDVGFTTTANGNSVQVVGNGSVWSNSIRVAIGFSGSSNSLVVTNGGRVFDGSAVVGSQLGSSSNYVQVVGGGFWQNSTLTIGGSGSSNSLVIDDGTVLANTLTIGLASPTCDNLVQLNTGSLAVTNNGSGVLEVRDGELILNGGTLLVDTLVITNSCASFVHTGGTLIAGSVVLDPNTFRITSVVQEGNDLRVTWLMGPGQTNTLQATAGGPDGSYNTNGFTDIFIVTNNSTVGAVTNYLDIGAATNAPSRFYQVRLVP